MLRRRFNKKNKRIEWALVSKSSNKVLEWYGKDKPGEGTVSKSEARVNWFKHNK